MSAASKQLAQKKEPIHERGVLLPVQRTISRAESDTPQKIMTMQIGGSMVKNSPENAAARAESDEDKVRAESCHFPGTIPRSLAVVAAGLGVGPDSSRPATGDGVSGVKTSGLKGERANKKMRNVDFGDAIGKELQNLYDDLVAQPVPDRFLNLLNQLEKNVVSSGRSNGAPGERE